MRVMIKSFPGPGWEGYRTPGHYWPAKGVEVEIVDAEEDPAATSDHQVPHIGQRTLREVQAESRLSIIPVEKLEDVMALKARIADLEAQLAAAAAAPKAKKG
jgi:hypothetical protein